MNQKKHRSFSLIAAFLAVGIAVVGCSQSDETSSDPVSNAEQKTTANNSSAGSQAATQPSRDISGSYSVTGSNPDGGGQYAADLTVQKRDDVYQFSWSSAGREYDGVGVQTDNAVAVAFTEGSDGTGCGVVLYNIASDGSLDGKAGYWGVNEHEAEKAVRTAGTDLEGTYNVTGTNTGGADYKGTLNVKKDGEGFGFTWNTGTVLNGFGMRSGNKAAVGFGGNQCGFVIYDVKSDGTLGGRWGGKGAKSFGTETAVKN